MSWSFRREEHRKRCSKPRLVVKSCPFQKEIRRPSPPASSTACVSGESLFAHTSSRSGLPKRGAQFQQSGTLQMLSGGSNRGEHLRHAREVPSLPFSHGRRVPLHVGHCGQPQKLPVLTRFCRRITGPQQSRQLSDVNSLCFTIDAVLLEALDGVLVSPPARSRWVDRRSPRKQVIWITFNTIQQQVAPHR